MSARASVPDARKGTDQVEGNAAAEEEQVIKMTLAVNVVLALIKIGSLQISKSANEKER